MMTNDELIRRAIERRQEPETRGESAALKMPLDDWYWVEYALDATYRDDKHFDPSDAAQMRKIHAVVQELILRTVEDKVGIHPEDRQ